MSQAHSPWSLSQMSWLLNNLIQLFVDKILHFSSKLQLLLTICTIHFHLAILGHLKSNMHKNWLLLFTWQPFSSCYLSCIIYSNSAPAMRTALLIFWSCPSFNPLANPFNSSFKLYSQPSYFHLPCLLYSSQYSRWLIINEWTLGEHTRSRDRLVFHWYMPN